MISNEGSLVVGSGGGVVPLLESVVKLPSVLYISGSYSLVSKLYSLCISPEDCEVDDDWRDCAGTASLLSSKESLTLKCKL